MTRAKVLFVAESVTLAHVVRLVTLAEALHRRGWQVVLASDPRYMHLVGPLGFEVLDIQTMPAARFQHAISTGGPIFDFPTLDRYVSDDLKLLARTQPQLVVGDFRISLSVSARRAQVPFVNLTNAYWSPLARIRRLVPEFAWVQRTGAPLAQLAFSGFQRIGYALHAVPVNRIRRLHGMHSIGHDFRAALMDGDLTLFADVPDIIPMAELPARQRFIGPVPWSPNVPLPAWWADIERRNADRPLVYVSLGSSGPEDVLPRVLQALADLPVDVMASAAGRQRIAATANVRVADMLPGDLACELADLVICNGGSPGTYQALMHGKPVVGLATNMDQFLNMAAVEDAGCGILLRSASTTVGRIRGAVMEALSNVKLTERARAAAQAIHATGSSVDLAEQAFLEVLGAPEGR